MATVDLRRANGNGSALREGDKVRKRLSVIRAGLRTGKLSVAAALEDQGAADMLLLDVIRCTRERRGTKRALAMLGRAAVDDGVNLALTVGLASPDTKAWVVEHARQYAERQRP